LIRELFSSVLVAALAALGKAAVSIVGCSIGGGG
jgi:hypothetical protein